MPSEDKKKREIELELKLLNDTHSLFKTFGSINPNWIDRHALRNCLNRFSKYGSPKLLVLCSSSYLFCLLENSFLLKGSFLVNIVPVFNSLFLFAPQTFSGN